MNNTRPSSASRPPSNCQNCSNRSVGTCESHAEKKITSNRVPGVPREHVGNLEADIRRPHPITSDLHHLGCRINRRHRVSQPRQRLRPQASPARDLQHASGWPHPRDQSRDTRTSCGNIAISRRVVLTRPATVVINLISQNLIGHPDIITRRCDCSRWRETQAPGASTVMTRPRLQASKAPRVRPGCCR